MQKGVEIMAEPKVKTLMRVLNLTEQEALEVIGNAQRGLLIEGVYRNGDVYYYGVGV